MRLSRCSVVALSSYASRNGGRLFARTLPTRRGRRAYFYILEASRSKALSLLLASGLAFRYGHFDGQIDRTHFFLLFFFSRRSIHPSIPVHGLPWSSMLHDHDDWSFVRFSFVVFPPSFSSGRFDPLPCYTHTDRTFTALSLINGGHRPYKYSRNVPRYLSVSRDRTSHYAQPGLIIYYRADTM